MKLTRSFALALVMAAVGAPAWASPQVDEHQGHHPPGTPEAPPPARAAASTPAPGTSSNDMARMDAQMKVMREMHSKMMAAKTPKERNAAMAEHQKAMQDGMSMMNKMFPSGMGMRGGMMPPGDKSDMKSDMHAHHQMMEKRMEMMQAMMQMMMDRLPTAPVK